ncbi:alpha/beta fold hydrolase [Ideonella livida]|uniref:Alpha/beta hydrolase n=1 Tax=Ideonella livida TaxID=2707176 RepID=A0A7C9TL81_9BURK|nr:alpha/beta hydrolase [Ideonella livida]NDY92402.1 alpha/beta hydrolase [Ideonella livida]
MTAADADAAYTPRRPARHLQVDVRQHWRYHLRAWGDTRLVTPERPALVLCHGYMDVGASFQFLVDALHTLEGEHRYILAVDWRGYGLTEGPPTDHYWFNDYLGDLDALLRHPELGLNAGTQPVDLLGHSMGGNVVMHYAGLRPTHIRRLINLEGFGMPALPADQAPTRLAQWLDDLATPQALRPHDSAASVARRLRLNNPRLPADKADWLATHWARPAQDGQWHILGDAAHKRVHGQPYRVEEVLACWRRITAPLLWVEGDLTEMDQWWKGRYTREEFGQRLAQARHGQGASRQVRLSPAGHMLHHDQPEALAQALQAFLDGSAPA